MFFNTILAFMIPWIVTILHLVKKDKWLIPVIGPFFSMITFIINEFGVYLGFWEVVTSVRPKTLAMLPFNVGVYPILACYLIYFVKKYHHPHAVILLMTLFTTCLEMIFVLIGKVQYGHGWNSLYTFLSYLIPYILVYLYYQYTKKLNGF